MYQNENIIIKKDTVAAVVVTFNRIELLKKVIAGLRNQTRKLDAIIVVNNSSTDGTLEWLEQQNDIFVVTQPNVGSSGGQYTGAKTAYQQGYEWIWQMDDDVVCEPDCLSNLLRYSTQNFVCSPLRHAFEGGICFNCDTMKINMSNPFKSIWVSSFNQDVYDKNIDNHIIEAEGITLEGPMFHRTIIDRVGLVDKNFFIFADDTEYCIRLKDAGIKTGILKSAIINRMLPLPADPYEFNWKTYYLIRNLIAIDVLHGNFAVRLLRPFGYMLVWLMRSRSFDNIKTVLKAFKAGYFYKS